MRGILFDILLYIPAKFVVELCLAAGGENRAVCEWCWRRKRTEYKKKLLRLSINTYFSKSGLSSLNNTRTFINEYIVERGIMILTRLGAKVAAVPTCLVE